MCSVDVKFHRQCVSLREAISAPLFSDILRQRPQRTNRGPVRLMLFNLYKWLKSPEISYQEGSAATADAAGKFFETSVETGFVPD